MRSTLQQEFIVGSATMEGQLKMDMQDLRIELNQQMKVFHTNTVNDIVRALHAQQEDSSVPFYESNDPEEYLEWEWRMEKVIRFQKLSKAQEILMRWKCFKVDPEQDSSVHQQEKTIVPKTANDVKLISGGKILENDKNIAQCRAPFGDLPSTAITMHVVVHPSSAKSKPDKKTNKLPKTTRCSCSIL